jgi:filamentous hemagglutinin
MSGPTNRRFVRSAWTLLAFQFVAATGATGLAVWAATRVQHLIDQRNLLQQRVTELESHPVQAPPPEAAPVEMPVEASPVENEVSPAPPPPPPPPPAATEPPRPRHVRPTRTPVIVQPPEVIYVPPPPPPPPPPPIKVEETPPPPPPPPRPRRERPRITITPFIPGINLGPRRPRQEPTRPSGQQQPAGDSITPNRTVGPSTTTAVPGQPQSTAPTRTTDPRRLRRVRPPPTQEPEPPK